ncbi:MAG TPA: hypothetical protein VFB38_19870 [Chthonomonadaceae bacterium]|nr:hypothetical protein [Chthonomonadaceae bacterium]
MRPVTALPARKVRFAKTAGPAIGDGVSPARARLQADLPWSAEDTI